jgi:sugar phosphate permease
MWTPVVTVVQRWFASGKRGLALGVLSTGYGLGFAAVGLAFPWIVRQFSWRHSWYFLGMGALSMVLINALFLRSSPEAVRARPWGDGSHPSRGRPPPDPGEGPFGLKNVLRSRVFWMIGLSYFCISYCLYGITTFMVDYARSQLGIPLERASLLATVHGISQVIGVLTILPLSDSLGRRRTILISNAFITLCMAGILVAGHAAGMLFWLVGILAVFYGATFPIYGACAGDYFPGRVMGTVVGAWTPFYGVGAILVHWVTGAIRDSTGSYSSAFAVNAVMAAGAVMAMAAARKAKQ